MDESAPARGARLMLRWIVLLALSVALVAALEALDLPAAPLLGPMIAAVLLVAANVSVRVPVQPYYLAQAVVGCMIARSMTTTIMTEMAHDWPVFIAAVGSVIVASNLLGWLLARLGVLPGTTAIWGASPGAATAMVLMSEAQGEDFRLVAFMQYLRVVFVAVAASAVARLWVDTSGVEPAPVTWFPPVAWLSFAETLAIAVVGVLAGRLLRIPAGPLLLPIALGAILQNVGLVTIELPPWLLVLSYALVGWSIGSRFTRPILRHAAHALPKVALAITTLIVVCGGFAVLLVVFADVDPLTAYLATSPGGADSVAIIAASSNVDMSFVMALQMARFIIVMLTGPAIAKFIAGRMKRSAEADAG
ncbi:AbrB family transcriptional regulator [Consotaella aegiceratis]|uniref:AbrB family transcriptional regulator n=1 Tax=Consotaella aegiceratis TaxID=3097961 RepID=UPI002F3F2DE6